MRYVGLDAHWRQSTICVLDSRGQKISVQTIRAGWSKVLAEVAKIRRPFSVCFEASGGYGFLFEKLEAMAHRVIVAHPGQLRLIFRSSRKNDRVDAEKLAKLLFLDEVPPVHVPSLQVRSWRSMIEHRRRLVADRTRAKNAIRALLRSHGVESPKRLWTKHGQTWLESVDLATDLDNLQRDIQQERVQMLTTAIGRVERALNQTAARHPGVILLQTIPGVGPRIAEAVVAYIDAPHRFHRSKAIGRYFGLVPRQDASGRSNRLGHITREGPSVVRGLLVEAAWQGIRRCDRIREIYERFQRGDKDRKKIAVVATAHYLLRVMLAMLRTGEVWRYTEATA
jgi:transposase